MTVKKKSWSKRTPETIELPSGAEAKLAAGPCMNRLIRLGVIATPFPGVEIDLSSGEAKKIDFRAQQRGNAAIVCATVFEPLVSGPDEEPVEGGVSYDDIPDEDVEFILTWARSGHEGIATFRQERARSQADSASKDLEADAKPVAGDK